MSASENLRTGERRNVTVLFADMKGFTSLSERMDPEEMEGLMSQVFGTFEGIITRYEGTVEKYIGDALVAVFGVPALHEDDAARAINASLDFLAEIARLNEQRRDRDPVAFRIGINTGLITTGKRGEHDVVTGHPMAVASRLESSAPENSILVSQSTRERCEHDFVFSEAQAIQARGKDEIVLAYEVRGRNIRLEDDDTVFVGRKPLLDRMLRSFLRHDPVQTQGFILLGEPGIGKTRLAQELMRKLRRLPDFDDGILFARARRYGTRPFSVIIDMLSAYFRIDNRMGAGEIAAVVEHELGIEHRTAEGFAALVSGATTEQDNQAFVLLYLILKSIVKKNLDAPYSTLLCIDDLYCIDKSSRDFFRFYLRNADARPFFLFLNRALDPGLRETFAELEVVELEPLDHEETLELIRALSDTDLDLDLVNSIRENARGNPLFIREYVRYARENRDAQALPSTIQNIFLSSIESYEPALRDLLKKLSVFAHSFSLPDARHVQSATDGDSRIVDAAIGFFLREGVLVEEDGLFMFRYDLFKTAVYDSLLNYNKRILHRIVADLMIEKGEPHPMRLLHHLFRAEEYDRATDALMDSPNVTTNVEYLRYVDRLLERVEEHDVDRYVRLMFIKSAILFNNGITEEADSLLKGMIETAVDRLSPAYAGSAYHLLTAHNMKAYCFEKARFCGAKALAYYDRAGGANYNPQNVLEIMASSELLRNSADAVDDMIERIRALERTHEAAFSAARLELAQVEHHLMRSEYRPAIEKLERLIHDSSEEDGRWHQMHLLKGLACFHMCDWDEARRADQIVLEGPSRHLSNISQTNARLAVAHHFLGDARAAERHLQQAEFNASQIRNDFDAVDALRTLSGCCLVLGDASKAEEHARRGLATSLRHTATYPVLTLLMVLVDTASARGDATSVEFFLQEASLLVDSGFLLPNRDTILYHYYAARYATDETIATSHRGAARNALDREIGAIADERLVEEFFRVRIFGRVRDELA
ncbi:MAG: adenylate/guanylate cyclase domain-containing protein [Spirochaetota bacterium]